MLQNTTAHDDEPKTKWIISEQDAFDIQTIASFVQRIS